MRIPRPFLAAALWVGISAGAPGAMAQEAYPSKPIRVIVPFAAGGPADVVAREMAQSLGKELGQTLVVENQGGGAGVPALGTVSRAPADGYTLLFAASGNVVIQPLLTKNRVDVLQQLSPVAMVTTSPHVLVVSSKLPVHTVKEFVAYAKAHPGQVNFASAGVGGLAHLGTELFERAAGIDARHVPYKGSSQAMTDLAGGEVQAMFSSLPSMKGLIDKGAIRVIGVTAPSASPAYKGIPVIKDAGVPNFEYTTWYGLYGPAGLPAAVVVRLSAALSSLAADKAFDERLLAQGVDLSISSARELGERTRRETATWDKVIREAGIQLN
ncbi:tripartite-type tricarboxylate transporter receptor subunit TctC [Pseudacidovorax intermedius]|uniref:Tripartite-type tricarboxylate transporter receptor subunit TctC n=1 Tax=Pseudacidovorax intermedius TaxID=433924 RepID=A0A370FQU4_9BURK|nr:tripartite tricarboxylate transporter substrate binding protein [Pseudacidovorax intermedius]RDI29221.1 tripartite-type tricarboxylate transporter receptor subunit TctC [Pseudacidovorax intermedius]